MIRFVVVVEDTLVKVEYRDRQNNKVAEAPVPITECRRFAELLIRAADRYEERQRELAAARGA